MVKQFVLLSAKTRIVPFRYYSISPGNEIRTFRDMGRLRGHNLSERYVRLAKSLKGKNEFLGGFNIPSTSKDTVPGKTTLKAATDNSFHGFLIPQPPKEPSSEGKLLQRHKLN
jgi:hypothetical protein